MYNKQELDIETIKLRTLENFRMITKNGEPVCGNDEWLAYALICWECKALDEKTLNVVKEIFVDKEGIAEEWEDLSEKRLKEIEKLLFKLQTPAKRIKTIKKEYFVDVPFKEGNCIVFKDKHGFYGGWILLQINKKGNDEPAYWTYYWGVTRIFQQEKPTLKDFIHSHFLVVNYGETIGGEKANWINRPELWITGGLFGKIRKENEKIEIENYLLTQCEVIGSLAIKKHIDTTHCLVGHFRFFHKYDQFEWEKNHPESIDLSYPVKKYLQLIEKNQDKKWWKFF